MLTRLIDLFSAPRRFIIITIPGVMLALLSVVSGLLFGTTEGNNIDVDTDVNPCCGQQSKGGQK
jgi:hypothetical protein